MIKKVIGIIVALAAIVVIIIAAMHGDKFSSLVFDEGEPASSVEATAAAEAANDAQVVVPDSTAVSPVPTGSAHPDSAYPVPADSVQAHPAMKR